MCIISIIAACLYCNPVPSGYVWDDRAAIVGNADVHGSDPIMDIFKHDFWGQNIQNYDSHKSYRPLTVLTYRINHMIHGLTAMGFHMGNVVVFMFACIAFYGCCAMFLKRSVAQLATLLFCLHPIHVESVASIVGRADALCGVFYCTAIMLYMEACSVSNTTGQSSIRHLFAYVASLLCAILACLSKEIGITIFGVFMIIEVISYFPQQCLQSHSTEESSRPSHKKEVKYPFKIFISGLYDCFTSISSICRILISSGCLLVFLYQRLQLHGSTTSDGSQSSDVLVLYEWTILEVWW